MNSWEPISRQPPSREDPTPVMPHRSRTTILQMRTPIEKKHGGTDNPRRPVLCKKKMTTLHVRPHGGERSTSERQPRLQAPSRWLAGWLTAPDGSPQSVLPACSHLDGEILRSDRDQVCRQGIRQAALSIPATDLRTRSIIAVGGLSALHVLALVLRPLVRC